MGRKATLTYKGTDEEKAKDAFLDAFVAADGRKSEALATCGVTRSQLDRWLQNDTFKDNFSLAELAIDDRLRALISRRLYEEDDVQVLKLAMKRLPEYKPQSTQRIEVSGQVKHIAEIPEETRLELIREAAKLIEQDQKTYDVEDAQITEA